MVKSVTGSPHVSIRFGDKEYLFIVDNAAGGNVMLPEVAKEIGLKTTRSDDQIIGAGGATQGSEFGIAEDVLIGGVVKLHKLDFRVTATPGGADLPDGAHYGGLLGNQFLSQLKVRMDFATYNLMLSPLGKGNPSPNAAENQKVIRIGEGQDAGRGPRSGDPPAFQRGAARPVNRRLLLCGSKNQRQAALDVPGLGCRHDPHRQLHCERGRH